MEWYVVALATVGALLLLMLIGAPIAVGMGLTSIALLLMSVGMGGSLSAISSEFYHFWTSYTLLAIPLFILMGEFIFMGGLGESLFEMASKWLSRLPGGLAMVTVGACAVFATLTGSSFGATATMGLIAIPQMLKRGYSRRLACGSVAAAGGLAHLIPPSVGMCIYCAVTDQSIGRMFMAAIIPGFLLAAAFGITCLVWALVNPGAAPREPPVSWRERLFVLRKVWAPIIIVLAVLGTIYTGIATATEAAALGAGAAMLLAIFSGKLGRQGFVKALFATAKTTGFIMFIAVAGKLLGYVMALYLIPQNLVRLATETQLPPLVIIVFMQVLYIIMGCFIDFVGQMVITMPVILPILEAFGFSPIWFGVMVFINFEMGLITPPFAIGLYIVKDVAKEVPLSEIFKGALVFCIADIALIALVLFFPQLALWLPSKMLG